MCWQVLNTNFKVTFTSQLFCSTPALPGSGIMPLSSKAILKFLGGNKSKGILSFFKMDWYWYVFRKRNQLIGNLTVNISGGCGKSSSKWFMVFILRNCGEIFNEVKIGLGLPWCFSIFVDYSSQYHWETGAIILPLSSAHTQLFIV